MCSITGAVPLTPTAEVDAETYGRIFTRALERGRDAWGVATPSSSIRSPLRFEPSEHLHELYDVIRRGTGQWVIGLNRGEPTTEHFKVDPEALSPHTIRDGEGVRSGPWTTVHNGTVANDHELALELGAPPRGIDSRVLPYVLERVDPSDPAAIAEALRTQVKGSYALAAGHEDGTLVLACNYKPIFTATVNGVLYFASLPHHLPRYSTIWSTVQKLDPYSVLVVSDGEIRTASLTPPVTEERALVVLSGGLDSTTVAAKLVADGYDVTAFHISYGCHATDRELQAVQAIADHLAIDLHVLETDLFQTIGGSTLLQGSGSDAVSGQEGSEYAHEWVPARNLIMASLAVAYAEAGGFDLIALGNNLEESGAYPDNEQEFIRALNAVMPNATQEGRRVRFTEPVGNLMKHEIVKLGLEIGAPLHLTYSCYRGGDIHCGTCGPCFMRHNAFRMNDAVDPLPYEQEVEHPV